MDHGEGKCTCENDGYIDWVARRAEKRPALLQPRVPERKSARRPLPADSPLAELAKVQGDDVFPAIRKLLPSPSTRRGFLRALVLGAGGFLAWQGGVRPPAAQACGGYEGDPVWDWTWYQGTGYFFSRAEWGARPPRQPVTILGAPPRYVVVHHTASANVTDYSPARARALSRSIQNWHMDNNGWIDAGQHFTVSRGGYMCEGRSRSTEIELLACYPSHVLGTHVANYNSTTLGIENEGTYTSVYPNGALVWSIITSVTTCCFYNSVPVANIRGHRDFNSTQCPGNRLYELLPTIRSIVQYLLQGGDDPFG